MHSESADSHPRRLHPVAALFGVARAVGSLIPLLIVAMLSGGSAPAMGWLLPLFLAVVLVEGIGGWWRFRYWVEAGEFRIERGFLVRRHSYVPLDLNPCRRRQRGPRAASVRVGPARSTDGQRKRALELSAISQTEAERLRRLLSAPVHAPVSGEAPAAKSYPLEHA